MYKLQDNARTYLENISRYCICISFMFDPKTISFTAQRKLTIPSCLSNIWAYMNCDSFYFNHIMFPVCICINASFVCAFQQTLHRPSDWKKHGVEQGHILLTAGQIWTFMKWVVKTSWSEILSITKNANECVNKFSVGAWTINKVQTITQCFD